MLEELGRQKLQERMSIAKFKVFHSFLDGYTFVTSSLLPSKAQSNNLRFKPILDRTSPIHYFNLELTSTTLC